ncbi:uncharacterized protein OCT59_012950 [Rhizophagus irregularis]|uniref:F-box domain-containing protein n=1 Tax=Rhizophagus irregularis (strain DAOM 197198w) TaxID=1432141 RepID=A0A015JIX6_RHIIW|nr:hypothetical protein RirG_230360 [Rhizophagus irregularis DAOM 197198w]UZO20527.1 hypothetical protein OCT59_012950 [Rhizophagus irregularis]
MAKLNKDILFLIFEELQEDSKSLFSCLMVNRLWCETVIPILWRNPWCYNNINYKNKIYLFFIIAYYLFDDIKDFITNQRIKLPSDSNQSLLFDYFSFCRSINVNNINNIISIGSNLDYNQYFIQQKFYYFFMKKCPELKYFDMKSMKHQIFYFPEAEARLESLCELKCDTSIDSSYYYGLLPFCKYIQRLIIINVDPKPNHGIAKLIEVQKNLKYFEWKDNFCDDILTEDPYEEVLLALEKKVASLSHLRICLLYVDNYEHALLQKILSKFYKLKILIIDDYLYFAEEQLEKLRMMAYHELEVISVHFNKLDIISSIIENNGRRIKKILFRPYDIIDLEFDDFNFYENSLNFIRKVYENCPSIEYLSITFPSSRNHFTEFEKLLKICQNLKSLLIVLWNRDKVETYEKNGEELLKILIRSAPTNLKEIRLGDDFKFSLENLEDFLEKWRSRRALSIFTIDPIYLREDYKNLINKYKSEGVIKNFDYLCYLDLINYCINVL